MVFGSGSKKGQFGKKEEVPDQEMILAEYVEKQEPEYTSLAFSMGRHPQSGFALYIVEFNPVTGEARVKETRSVGESRAQSEDAFRVEVGHFFGQQELKGQ